MVVPSTTNCPIDRPLARFAPLKSDALKPVAYLGEHVPLAPGRVVLDPRVFAKMLEAIDVTPRDLVLDVGSGLGYSAAVLARLAEAVVGVEADAALAAEAEATLRAQGVDNAVVEAGPLAAGVPGHGPYDAVVVEGGIEVLPQAIADQLKPGGRIVAIVMNGANGQARLGLKTPQGIDWRRVFDASAPILPGFAAAKAFEF